MLRSVLCVMCPSVPFRPRLFLISHVLFGPVCFVSVRTFLVLAIVPVRLPSLSIYATGTIVHLYAIGIPMSYRYPS